MPMASPPSTRATINSVRLRGSADPKEETVNNAAAAINTLFLPKRSLVKAARLAPTTHPRSRLLAAISVCESLSPNWLFRHTIAPLITAASATHHLSSLAATAACKDQYTVAAPLGVRHRTLS